MKDFESIEVNPDWCFKNVRSVEQWTHGYHRYPAKFLPNVVKKLIEEYSTVEGTIADLFAGCGTTLVEAKAHGKDSIGTDINPVAELITKAKTNTIEPKLLEKEFCVLFESFLMFSASDFANMEIHKRINYWFTPESKAKIAFLYEKISEITQENIQNFFLVSLSHILKNCSRWLQSSTKPQVDKEKNIKDVFEEFKRHSKKMMTKNRMFYEEIARKDFSKVSCEIRLEDARKTSIKPNSIGTIITSPPYVTSYEYADIHQLTGYWYKYFTDLKGFRKNFIGTFYSANKNIKTESLVGQEIVDQLQQKDKRTAFEVANYFNDMSSVGDEMYRILKKDGHACIVIGNTTFKDVKIKSAEVLYELLQNKGFKEKTIIKRSIPHKLMPTIREIGSGRFTKLENKDSKLVYPEEYILIMQK